MAHFVIGGNFQLRSPPPTAIAVMNANENVIDELTIMSPSSNQHCSGGRESSAIECSTLHRGKNSLNAKAICPNEFCPPLWVTIASMSLL